nr:hypothetical protein BACY1_23820 [Tenacibaculum mesophilum]
MLLRTSTNYAPWYVIPADDKPTARYIVAKTLEKELEKYNFKEPTLPKKVLDQIDEFKKELTNE